MKKSIFITIGVLIILILIGVWAYLFMYGTPKNSSEVFARFGIGQGNEISPVSPEDTYINVSPETENDGPQNLRQLTTRPVAGSSFDETGILYVEQGTGHIYHIDLTTGAEKLVNGTTIPQSTKAIFSQDGSRVAITSFNREGGTTIAVMETRGDSANGFSLPAGAREVAFGAATGTIHYLLDSDTGSSGYTYNLIKETSTRLFTIPLQDVRVLWGVQNYVYTTPTGLQEGHLYKISGNKLNYVTQSGFGLTAFLYKNNPVVTRIIDNKIKSSYIVSNEESSQPLPLIPEKCISENTYVFCAIPTAIDTLKSFPDDWHKGSLSYTDILWQVNIEKGEVTALSNFFIESGREIDVIQIGTNVDGNRVWFINKNDNALWMFDTTL